MIYCGKAPGRSPREKQDRTEEEARSCFQFDLQGDSEHKWLLLPSGKETWLLQIHFHQKRPSEHLQNLPDISRQNSHSLRTTLQGETCSCDLLSANTSSSGEEEVSAPCRKSDQAQWHLLQLCLSLHFKAYHISQLLLNSIPPSLSSKTKIFISASFLKIFNFSM